MHLLVNFLQSYDFVKIFLVNLQKKYEQILLKSENRTKIYRVTLIFIPQPTIL